MLLFFRDCVVAVSMTTLYWPSSGLTYFSQRGQVITGKAPVPRLLSVGGVAVRGRPPSVFGASEGGVVTTTPG